MTEILTLKNPHALELPDIRELVDEAFESVTKLHIKAAFFDSYPLLHNEVLVARKKGKWVGLAWLSHPTREDDLSTSVLHFFIKGGVDAREALIQAIVESAREHGSTTLFAWDMNNKPRAFMRLFKSAGGVKEAFRAYEFDLSEARY